MTHTGRRRLDDLCDVHASQPRRSMPVNHDAHVQMMNAAACERRSQPFPSTRLSTLKPAADEWDGAEKSDFDERLPAAPGTVPLRIGREAATRRYVPRQQTNPAAATDRRREEEPAPHAVVIVLHGFTGRVDRKRAAGAHSEHEEEHEDVHAPKTVAGQRTRVEHRRSVRRLRLLLWLQSASPPNAAETPCAVGPTHGRTAEV
eukprot:2547923-Prymnesium_polylepis.1